MDNSEPVIKILPEDVTNKIAAGEVIERPASVVKELIENSVDAHAKRITINLVASGLRLIEVIDDGIGMSEQNALLSIERHATSKIKTEKDLSNIRTYGFRGEALSSISAVSLFVLTTRRRNDKVGTEIVIHGGTIKSVTQVGCPPGTKVSVNRLFYNTPVRLKFMKGLTTELSHCVDVVQKYVLSHTEIGFSLIHNDKLLFEIPPETNLSSRIEILWGNSTRAEMIEVLPAVETFEDGENHSYTISVSGFVGLPSLTRSNRSYQFFFVNNRPVYNRILQISFEEAYRNLITTGKYPIGILFIEIPPYMIDINIHPTKKEIKFRDEKNIRSFLQKVIRSQFEKLTESTFHKSLVISPIKKEDYPSIEIADSSDIKNPTTISSASESVQQKEILSEKLIDDKLKIDKHKEEFLKTDLIENLGYITPKESTIEGEKTDDNILSPHPSYMLYEPMEQVPLQIFDSYLVVTEKDRLLIIDQHALHERLIFEKLKKELVEENFSFQRLIVPIVIEVPKVYNKILEENLQTFKKIGIEIEPFGENTFQILGICYLYDEGKVKELVFSILDELMQGELFQRKNYIESLLAIATRACKGAIKAGDKLEVSERIALVEGFRKLVPPYTCPHGRPILIELTIQQMEKTFRRRQ
ncbi:MAG: DNA mismatch repair endonuclease MutL [Candidatus Hydrogenedentes bacterium]|nr:DNA mismatch repair endonuclease MutL [Candidatus Hydrogenedentota bacterium]